MPYLYYSVCARCREINEFLEFECHYAMDVNVLKFGVAYKYCVINSQHKDEYEELQCRGLPTPKSGIRNRYLKISQEGMHGSCLIVCMYTSL